MSEAAPRQPKAATCEEWDEATQSVLPGSRTDANVAIKRSQPLESEDPPPPRNGHDGSDSGYSSKAVTVASMSSDHRKKGSDLKVNTTLTAERERQPYSYSAKPVSQPQLQRQPSAVRPNDKAVHADIQYIYHQQPFVHERGRCWVCDQYGYHFDISKGIPQPEIESSTPSATTVRRSSSKAPNEGAVRPVTHQISSSREGRPVTMYGGMPTTPYQVAYTPHVAYGAFALPQEWQHTITPLSMTPYGPPGYHYPPPTPMSASYASEVFYYDHPPMHEPPPSKPRRRESGIGAHEQPRLDHKPVKPSKPLDRIPTKEKRMAIISHDLAWEEDQDRLKMPPPPKPQPEFVLAHRPSNRRAQTDHPTAKADRRSRQYTDEEFDEVRAYISAREAAPSPSRPPSSYRPPTGSEHMERPRPSKSYSTPGTTTKVAASSQQPPMQRRTTIASTSMEQKEADAEAYQRKRGTTNPVDLTAEALKKHTQRNVSAQSESGSTRSHRTHASKDSSAGQGRATTSTTASNTAKTNITINGINLSIPHDYSEGKDALPVKIDLGGVRISMNSDDRDKTGDQQEQKRLERALSVGSKTSRRSFTSGSGVSSSGKTRERELDHLSRVVTRDSSRHSSYEDDRHRIRESAPMSRQSSRGTNNARTSADYGRNPGDKYRSSVEYALPDEHYVYNY